MDQKRKRRRPPTRGVRRPVKKTRPENKTETVRVPAQEVVYTAPDPISRKKLILGLATVASIVLALFLACTVFFKVENIQVSGNFKYDEWTVFEASGIEKGDSLLTFGKGKACAKIVQSLPYVKIVRIGITLPNTVNIYIEELDVVYAAQDTKDGWWLMTSGGRVVEKTSASVANGKSKLEGFRIQSPEVGKDSKAAEPAVDPDHDKPVTVTAQDRMDMALTIVTELERMGILGQVTSVNVQDLGKLRLQYGSTYQVELGDASQMEKKLKMMVSAIRSREAAGNTQKGILDITFEIYTDAVGFKPFDLSEEDAVCAAQDSGYDWWLLAANGQVVKKTSASMANSKIKIKGVLLQSPVVGQGAKPAADEPETGDGEDEMEPVTNQQRLDMALSMVAELELRGVLAEIASINVENMADIILWYGETYEVKLGDGSQLEKKLEMMCQDIGNRGNEGNTQGGVLDITFESFPDGVGFQPFE